MRLKIILLLFLILTVSAVSHLYKLEKLPPGISNDEADIGYDAYSVLKTGRDQWGDFLPLFFKGFGDYRGGLYTYALIAPIALFGLNAFSIRLPNTLFSLGTIIGVYLLGKRFFNKKAGLAAAFFTAFSPWYFGMTRVGIEAPMGTFFMVFGTLFFLRGLKINAWLFMSTILFSFSLYSYYAHRFLVPIYLLALIFVYFKDIRKKASISLSAFLLFILLSLPIIMISISGQGQIRVKQILFTKDIGVINRINEQRAACQQELISSLCRVVHNKIVDFGLVFLRNYLAHFSPRTLYVSGLSSALSVMPPGGLFLMAELPLFLFGLYYFVKQRKKGMLVVIIWLLFAPLPDSLTSTGHYGRFLIAIPSFQLVSGYGLYKIASQNIFPLVLALLVIGDLFLFSAKYFGSYARLFSRRSHYEYRPLFRRLLAVENDYEAIYVSRGEYDTKQYIFYLFFKKYDPFSYQNRTQVEKIEEPGSWIHVKRIGKWHFVDSLPVSELVPENSLIVGGSNEFKGKRIKNFEKTTHLDGSDAFYLIRNCTKEEREKIKLQEKLAKVNPDLVLPLSDCYY